jgi:hypothetical protein
MMLFQKLKKESEPDSSPKRNANGEIIVKKYENQTAFDDDFEGEYYVTEDKHQKEFFFDESSYKDWLKNSYQKAGRLLDSNKPPPTDKVFDMVTENQEMWDFDDRLSIFVYPLNQTSAWERFQGLMSEPYKDYETINKMACSHGWFDTKYVELLLDQMKAYKMRILRGLETSPEKYLKKKKIRQKRKRRSDD